MTEWVVVADSSPLIGLARIGQLETLRELASRVLMPPAVRDEITQHRREAPGAATIRQAAWIEVETPDHLEAEALAILVDAAKRRPSSWRRGFRVPRFSWMTREHAGSRSGWAFAASERSAF